MKEYPSKNQSSVTNSGNKHKSNNASVTTSMSNENNERYEDHVTRKLKEIRNKTKPITPETNLRDSIEKSVEKLVSRGLSITEAIEYESNQIRTKQLHEKMNNHLNKTTNQYNGTTRQHNA